MYIETIAIIIGVSYYLQDDITPLPAAEIDAVNFARAFDLPPNFAHFKMD